MKRETFSPTKTDKERPVVVVSGQAEVMVIPDTTSNNYRLPSSAEINASATDNQGTIGSGNDLDHCARQGELRT